MKSKTLVHGIGINDADYVTQLFEQLPKLNGKRRQKLIWSCPYYNKWKSMIGRCYYEKSLVSFPTYRSCTVTAGWLRFSCFREWYVEQERRGVVTDGGIHLDKDLLGNGVYSPEVCVFIHPKVNTFIKDNQNDRGELPLGVSCSSRYSAKFEAWCRTPFKRRSVYLGISNSESALIGVSEEVLISLGKKLEANKQLRCELARKFTKTKVIKTPLH